MKKIILNLILLTTIFVNSNAQKFSEIPVDKQYHIGAGVVAGVWGTFAGNSLELTPEESALFGVATGFAAGLGKEIWDISWCVLGDKNATFDTMDIAATTLGGIIGSGLSYAAIKIFKKNPPIIYSNVNKGFEVGIKIKI